jgi:hypothetical protein
VIFYSLVQPGWSLLALRYCDWLQEASFDWWALPGLDLRFLKYFLINFVFELSLVGSAVIGAEACTPFHF